MVRFEHRSVVVTGAASGIGRAACLRFAAEGARVLAFDRDEAVHDTARAIRDDGGSAVAMVGDAGNEPDIIAMLARAEAGHGGVDVIFANAGVSGGLDGLFEQSAADFAEILRINLIGVFLAIQHGAPKLIARGGGAIVCTASVAGLRAGAGGPAYSASKAGVINLVATAAQQLTGSHVRVNAICPGLIETGMTRFVFDAADAANKRDRIGELTPLRRAGQPDEIAETVLFLASDAASYITGQALVVDGGLSSSHPFRRPRELGRTTL